jgi:itaconate CoA-transferase
MEIQGDLEGILVVALEQAVAAPYASSRLADAGARVIKVERAEGDFARGYDRAVKGQASYFVWLNRGKESLALDIKSEADRALLTRMIAKADVFIQNLAPGAAARAGFASAALRARHPSLITCDISGYGEDGPYREMKAYDLLIQAEVGLCSVTGGPESPARVGVSVCDIAAGMTAHAAILQALFRRERRGGLGQGIEVSLFAALADWMTVPWMQFVYGGAAPARLGVAHATIAPYGAFPIAGGYWCVLSIQNEREWRRLVLEVLDAPEMLEDARFQNNSARVAHRPAVDAAVAQALAKLDREAAATRLRAADIAFGFLNDVKDFAIHPQLRTEELVTPMGVVDVIERPARLASGRPSLRPVPSVDQHGAQLRAEFA